MSRRRPAQEGEATCTPPIHSLNAGIISMAIVTIIACWHSQRPALLIHSRHDCRRRRRWRQQHLLRKALARLRNLRCTLHSRPGRDLQTSFTGQRHKALCKLIADVGRLAQLAARRHRLEERSTERAGKVEPIGAVAVAVILAGGLDAAVAAARTVGDEAGEVCGRTSIVNRR